MPALAESDFLENSTVVGALLGNSLPLRKHLVESLHEERDVELLYFSFGFCKQEQSPQTLVFALLTIEAHSSALESVVSERVGCLG